MKYNELERRLRCRIVMKKVTVTVERGEDNTFSAYISSGNCEYGCVGEGKTVRETEDDFLDAVEDMRTVYEKNGKPFPEYEFVFTYDISSFLNYYAYAFSLAGLERITGVNQRQLSHYLNGVRRPSKATAKKIEKSIKLFADELMHCSFL